MSYASKLREMGIVESRIDDLYEAMNGLHRAISKLDNRQLKAFSSTFGLIGHLDMFAREEGLRNVAVDMYNCALRESVKRIDFDEFSDFSDKLFYLAEGASEVGIPGAQQLCRSLCDIRSKYELSRMPFSALAKKAQNIAEIHGNACWTDYLYTNEDECIGKALTLWSVDRENTMGESGTTLIFINVELDDMNATDEDIKKAINRTFRSKRCGHEYDCCGCVSEYPVRMKKLCTNNWHDTTTWVVLMAWYLNI